MFRKLIYHIAVLTFVLGHVSSQVHAEDAKQHVPINDSHIVLAPYVWKLDGAAQVARAEAAMPGAYLRAVFQGSKTVGIEVDGTLNNGCPAESLPVVECSVDAGPFKTIALTKAGELLTLPFADGLDAGKQHHLDLYFRAGDQTQQRWKASNGHLRLASLVLDAGGTLLPCTKRSKTAIGFGDSITEGMGVDGHLGWGPRLAFNSARCSWLPLVCVTLGCEYGQLGSGGQGMVTTTQWLPPLPQTWDHYDLNTSRLVDGRLSPEPDYVFCAMGTNDSGPEFDDSKRFIETYGQWLAAVRKACPQSRIFCIIMPLGIHADDIRTLVATQNQAGDSRVYVIDTAPLKDVFSIQGVPTQAAHDGVHPSMYGNALMSALIASEIQKQLDRK
jgi:lysophospholipase L1-like esterase